MPIPAHPAPDQSASLVVSAQPEASAPVLRPGAAAGPATGASPWALPAASSPSIQSSNGRRQPPAAAAAAAELASVKMILRRALRHFPDFPVTGIDFVDIMPLFADPAVHACLLRALELHLAARHGHGDGISGRAAPIDVVVGLDARGFLFGPALALRLGAAFVPVRKKGKLPGACVTAEYRKEYGVDLFQMQVGAIRPGQHVLIVDDIIATGGSASAATSLVSELGGVLDGYLFILEIPGLAGRDKLGDVPVDILLQGA